MLSISREWKRLVNATHNRRINYLSMAGSTALPSTLFTQTSSISFPFHKIPCKFSSPSSIFDVEKRVLARCWAKKKISFVDQILDYIEGGPKLRKWYGAPDLRPRDASDEIDEEEEDEFPEEARDAVLVTNGDSEIGQMVILSLIVKRTRIKALVKDKRNAMESFGTYVESMAGDTGNKTFLKKALRGVRAIICPSDGLKVQNTCFSLAKHTKKDLLVSQEGFISNVGSLKGVQHVILLSQLSVYGGSGGIQALMKGNARKLAEQDEATLIASGIPYTIIRAGMLQNTPGGKGFRFEQGCATNGSLSKEDAASICVEALDSTPKKGLIFEVANGEEKVSDWKELFTRLMEKTEQ
ncbi:NAD(P)-binding Rossmann-fold superfamily protein [Melia azedarach]|uniref:NAD(P)-binding Rossmann-fold superfamily protein n=1 Tax=Melia azedarach TaxID=155640 RepID=A0ACC1Y3S8_MELAZ|nr:NAD(P)-binding Rossmann-fold superfamily protein [Melia azedarach]